jgi:hypothetical protein
MKWILRSVFSMVGLSQLAVAVVQTSGNANNTAPGGQPFFSNIGTLNGASVIYLANGWAMTANHVASSLPAMVNFGGVNYGTQAGSFQRLNNPLPEMSTFTDIVLFRLSAIPPLSALGISTSTPTVGSEVMMIGNGRIQESSETEWTYTEIPGDGNDTWIEAAPGEGNISGYKTTGIKEVRWGENAVHETLLEVNLGTIPAPVDILAFTTQFDEGELTNEAQAVVGDSGGGVFSYNGSEWELSGMMVAVGTYENQPNGAESAIYGGQTLVADLSFYRPQILAIIPEPSSVVLFFGGACLLGRRRR